MLHSSFTNYILSSFSIFYNIQAYSLDFRLRSRLVSLYKTMCLKLELSVDFSIMMLQCKGQPVLPSLHTKFADHNLNHGKVDYYSEQVPETEMWPNSSSST
jgi:hypothetical protein